MDNYYLDQVGKRYLEEKNVKYVASIASNISMINYPKSDQTWGLVGYVQLEDSGNGCLSL